MATHRKRETISNPLLHRTCAKVLVRALTGAVNNKEEQWDSPVTVLIHPKFSLTINTVVRVHAFSITSLYYFFVQFFPCEGKFNQKMAREQKKKTETQTCPHLSCGIINYSVMQLQ